MSPPCLCACICLPPSLGCTTHDLHPPPLFGAATVRPCRCWASFLSSSLSLSRFFVRWCKGQWCSGSDPLREGVGRREAKGRGRHLMDCPTLSSPLPRLRFHFACLCHVHLTQFPLSTPCACVYVSAFSDSPPSPFLPLPFRTVFVDLCVLPRSSTCVACSRPLSAHSWCALTPRWCAAVLEEAGRRGRAMQ